MIIRIFRDILISYQPLCSSNIRTDKLTNFKWLNSAVVVIEAFRAVTSSCCKIFIRFEFPITPTNKNCISCVNCLSNFDSAFFWIKASSEFWKKVRDTNINCILSAGINSIFVPLLTNICITRTRFTSFTNWIIVLTTIRMII